MMLSVAYRMLTTVSPRLLWRFAWGAGWRNLQAIRRFERRRRRGEPYYPAFVFISLTNRCNLRCRGCWVSPTPPADLPLERVAQIIETSRRHGSRFFGLLGGEPLLYAPLFELLGRFPDCYFQLFTNGQGLDEAVARDLRRLGNVTPLISIEGAADSHAVRRGSSASHGGALRALAACRAQGLVFGVATSVCRSSQADVVSVPFLESLARAGAHYVWYYIYRPAGSDPAPEEALSGDDIDALRAFIVTQRCRQPLVIVDAYWDHLGRALCPAATGISVHINAQGDVEPCPPIQFADVRATAGQDLATAVAASPFLTGFRREIPVRTRGCVLLEDPAALQALVADTGARDTTGRDGTGELAARFPQSGHHRPGHELPEPWGFYRLAKRHWFFGFGAYG